MKRLSVATPRGWLDYLRTAGWVSPGTVAGNDRITQLWAEKNRNKLQAFQIEVSRLLHNFLASVKSLVEHTRILLVHELYQNDAFADELKAKTTAEFADSELSHLVQDLRNYILHKGIPMTSARLHWARDSPSIDSSIQLDIKELKKWGSWSKPSLKYLSTLGDQKALHEIVDSYAQLVIGFHEWVKKRQEELHKNEFDEMKALNAEYEKALDSFGFRP